MIGRRNIKLGISMMLDEEFQPALLPLVEDGLVDILEWSFDTCWSWRQVPRWAQELIEHYSKNERLLGHGIHYSALSLFSPLHSDWLARLSEELAARRYVHITEHFGFSQAGHVIRGAPLPMPYTPEALAIGKENLDRLKETARCPLGLENLALAFGRKDVSEQGIFINDLIGEIEGFVLLDLHNLYCQIHNFSFDAEYLIEKFSPTSIKELHISGGSWMPGLEGRKIRRDTHDDDVPEALFPLLELTLSICPNVEYVVLERLGNSLKNNEDVGKFQQDFKRLKNIVRGEC